MHYMRCLLVFVVMAMALRETNAYEIECRHLYYHLKRHIRSSHDWPTLDEPDVCMSDAFIRKTMMYTNTSMLQSTDTEFVLSNDSMMLAELVALALIGRHFVQQEAKQVFFFTWNQYHKTLSLDLLPCEFSRPLYNFVLLCSLLTIFGIIVLQGQIKAQSKVADVSAEKDATRAPPLCFRESATTARRV
jgi:hypothetical protein